MLATTVDKTDLPANEHIPNHDDRNATRTKKTSDDQTENHRGNDVVTGWFL